jgi:hypothetical protein
VCEGLTVNALYLQKLALTSLTRGGLSVGVFHWQTNSRKRMAPSAMLRRMALVRTDVSEGLRAFIIRVTKSSEIGTLVVTSNGYTLRRLLVTTNVVPISLILVTLMMEALSPSETSVLTRAIQRNIPEDSILHNHRRENLRSYN